MENKNIIRVEKNKDYVVINKTVLKDKRLSWKAKGLMAYMLAMPDDWTFYLEELETHSTDGETSFRSGFNELKKLGYVNRKRDRISDGTFEWRTIVYEIPVPENQQVDNQQVENLQVDNHELLSTKELSTDKLSIKEVKTIVGKPDITNYSEIVNYLNAHTDRNYKTTTKKTQQLIKTRMGEGFTIEDFKVVIDKKVYEWLGNEKWENYLRPETLFGNKFESYLNQSLVKNESDKPDMDDLRKQVQNEQNGQRENAEHIGSNPKQLRGF